MDVNGDGRAEDSKTGDGQEEGKGRAAAATEGSVGTPEKLKPYFDIGPTDWRLTGVRPREPTNGAGDYG